MLTVHHLQVSQSERVVWLCEELGIQYELKLYKRSPIFSPPQYLALHPIGAAPVISDGELTIAESEACVEYIINVHGNGKLTIKPGEKNYGDYLYWLHFSNGTLQPAIGRLMTLRSAKVDPESNVVFRYDNKLNQCLEYLDRRLGETKQWLAGEQFTAADVMIVFSLTTMRVFFQFDISKYENVLAYLQRVAKREAYRQAMKKGDPDLDVQSMMQGPPPPMFPAMRQR